MLLGVVLEKIYGEPFDVLLAREIEKAAAPRQRHAARSEAAWRRVTPWPAKVLPTFAARIAWPSTVAALQRREPAALCVVAAGGARCLGETGRTSRPGRTPDKRRLVAMFWIVSETPRGRRLHYS
jgi:hypothetical protein